VHDEYPDLVKFIAPIPSPMELQGEQFKKAFPDAYSVFISPCTSKKTENTRKKAFDLVITFAELDKLFEKAGLQPLDGLKESAFDKEAETEARLAILSSTENGLDRCRTFLDNFDAVKPGSFLELCACKKGCAGRALKDNTLLPEKILLKAFSLLQYF
jgi:iron only hydrogenase large subunit-like protein